jgi:hypothetical protein
MRVKDFSGKFFGTQRLKVDGQRQALGYRLWALGGKKNPRAWGEG